MTSASTDTSVVVIGGGQAGLSVSFYLKRLGLDPGNEFVVLDRGPITGGAWQFRWEALRIGSAHRINDLPGFDELGVSFETADRHAPAKEVVADYYERYEQHFGFQVVRPASVSSVENHGANLRVTFNDGQGAQHVTTDIVINATGTWGSPFIPWYPGLRSFEGRHVHTTEYRDAADFAGKKVVVVGGGTSAIGFLLELEHTAQSLTWVSRRPIEFLEDGELNLEARASAVAIQDEAARAGRALPSIVSGTGVPRTRRIQAGIDRGLLNVRPMFASIEPNGVRWADGEFAEADVIIWSTGFRPELRHLAPLRLREKEGGIVVANGTAWKDGRIFFAGYGPQASTIGANRAGRTIARQAVATLSRLKREEREERDERDEADRRVAAQRAAAQRAAAQRAFVPPISVPPISDAAISEPAISEPSTIVPAGDSRDAVLPIEPDSGGSETLADSDESIARDATTDDSVPWLFGAASVPPAAPAALSADSAADADADPGSASAETLPTTSSADPVADPASDSNADEALAADAAAFRADTDDARREFAATQGEETIDFFGDNAGDATAEYSVDDFFGDGDGDGDEFVEEPYVIEPFEPLQPGLEFHGFDAGLDDDDDLLTSEVEREFTISRVVDASPQSVFAAWTEPSQLGWFSSGIGSSGDPIEVDLTVGGAWKQTMVVSDDTSYVTGGVYREIILGEKLVFSWGATDGWPLLSAEHPDDSPIATVMLDESADQTEMLFHLQLPGHLSQERVREWWESGIREGWMQTLDRLVAVFRS
ncbi:MAG: NAD(P)-binding domain-containing protein [Microbacteriaceae bacterium]